MKMNRTHVRKGRFAAAMAGLCLAAALSAPADAAPITEDEVLAKIERHMNVTGNAGAEAKWRGVLALVFGGPGDAMSVADLEAQVARSQGQPWQAVWDGVWEAWEAKLAAQQQQDPPAQQDEQPEDQQQPAAAPPVAAQDEQPPGYGSPQEDEQQDQQQQLIGQGQQDQEQRHPHEYAGWLDVLAAKPGAFNGHIRLRGDKVTMRGIERYIDNGDGTRTPVYGPSLDVVIGADGTGSVDTHGGGSYFSIPNGHGVGENFIANIQAERTPADFRAWGYWATWTGAAPSAANPFIFSSAKVSTHAKLLESVGAGTATYRGEAVGMATYKHGNAERVIAFTDAPVEMTLELTAGTIGDFIHPPTLKLGQARWRNPGSSVPTENWRGDIAHLRKDVTLVGAIFINQNAVLEHNLRGETVRYMFVDDGETILGAFANSIVEQPADPGNGRATTYDSKVSGAFSAERQ